MARVLANLKSWWIERGRRAALPGFQTICAFSGGRCAEIRFGSSEPERCANCDNGRARYLSGLEVEQRRLRYESDLKDGWINSDGSICDREIYAKALAKGTTPAALMADE